MHSSLILSRQRTTATMAPDPVHHLAIVERFRTGDARAASEIRTRVRRILSFRAYGIPKEDRADLEQLVMTQLWRAVARPGFAAEGFWGLLEIVVSRRCIDWIRAQRPEEELEAAEAVSADGPDPLAGVIRKERIALAEAALAKLPAECRRLIRLRVVEERSYEEIARLWRRSAGSLRVSMHRCVRRAGRILRELSKEGRGGSSL